MMDTAHRKPTTVHTPQKRGCTRSTLRLHNTLETVDHLGLCRACAGLDSTNTSCSFSACFGCTQINETRGATNEVWHLKGTSRPSSRHN
ncbi:hypothetical protein BaRGS_00021133 [Batillaria attramentaria]|uniref:Uncharacterized protein n=1 Tax=Batillaria attramentaria TaxID=370345 RepID=A0ABD0KK48_9CAEN